MTSQQLSELNELKVCLSRLTVIDKDDLRGLFCDYVHNVELHGRLLNPSFSEAVWYCSTYRNCDRVVVVNKLFNWLVTQQGLVEAEAKNMTEIALYVGGIDEQLKDIRSLIQKNTIPNNVGANVGFSPNPNTGAGLSGGGSSSHPWKRTWLWIVTVIVALMAFSILVGKCGKVSVAEQYSVIDICRYYEGTINLGKTKSCKMGITVMEDGMMRAAVTNIYYPNDVANYTCRIKDGKLDFIDGPRLQITQTTNGKIVLSCDHNKFGKWFFKSK